MKLLHWKKTDHPAKYETAILGVPDDNVVFTLTYHPTCYRRGPWRLLIEVCGGENHLRWGCLDEADQPLRNYHLEESARAEADEIARVLLEDRRRAGYIGW